MRGARSGAVVVVLGLATGCWIFWGAGTTLTPGESGSADVHRPAENQVLEDWLECEECLEGELAAVVRRGDAVVPRLLATAERGLSPARRELLRIQLADRYAARVAWGREHPGLAPAISQEAWVAHHLERRDRLHRVRAIRALGAIDSPAADDALRSLLARVRHAGVTAEIRRTLGGT